MTGRGEGRRAVVVGATGLLGRHLVEILAADPTVGGVLAPGRRAHPRWRDWGKVESPVVDFGNLDDAGDAFRGDLLFVCLGTTMKKAGNREAFRQVDYEAVVASATKALAGGALHAFLVSSVGADRRARSFYLRVKGEAEEALAALPFRSVDIFRPSILTGDRQESRPAERLGIVVTSLLAPLMVGPARRYRPIPALVVARAMARAAGQPVPGRHVHESEEIAEFGR